MTSHRRVVVVGDIARVAIQLDRALTTHTDWSVQHVPVLELGSARSRAIKTLAMPVRMVGLLTRVSARVRNSGADLVHVHWARYAPLVLSGSMPMVIHAHGSDVRGWHHGIGPGTVRRSLEHAAAVIVSTPDLLDDVPDGSVLMPNPIDCTFWTGDIPQDVNEGRPTVLIHARLTPVKGVDVLLAVARSIRECRPGVRLLAFGGTTMDEAARRAGIELLTSGSTDVVRRAIHSSDVVLGQQRLGVLGLSELEAMACGKPVVMPINRSLYRAAVPVVNASGIIETVDACTALLDDASHRAAIGAEGRRYVLAHHDLPVVAVSLVTLYEGLL